MSSTVAYVLVAFVLIGALAFVANRWFARRSAGAQAQLRFKRQHGPRVLQLLGAASVQDRRRNSPWINIRWGRGEAGMVSARLHRGRMQAAVRLDDVRLPVEIWHARPSGGSEFDVIDGIDRAHVEPLVERLAALHVDSIAAGDLDGFAPPVVRVQYDDVEELPARFERIRELLDEVVALRCDQPELTD